MIALTFVLVLIRLYIRVYQRSLWSWSDVFVIIAWIWFAAQGSMDMALLKLGFFNFNPAELATAAVVPTEAQIDDLVTSLKIVYVEDLTYYSTVYVALPNCKLVFES